MKLHMVAPVLILAACGGLSREKFYQDKENAAKASELTAKMERTSDCDKLGQLYEFSKKKNPTVADLEQILPLLGVAQKDFKNIDKLYALDYKAVDKYQCTDNRVSTVRQGYKYCKDKYYDEYGLETAVYFPFRVVSTVSVLTIVGAIPFGMHSCGIESAWHPIACRRKLDCETWMTELFGKEEYYANVDKDKLKERLKAHITSIYSIPREYEYAHMAANPFDYGPSGVLLLNDRFSRTDLVNANASKIGICADVPSYHKCYPDKTVITKLDAAELLWDTCHWLNDSSIDGWIVRNYKYDSWEMAKRELCACFAHKAYNNTSFKNFLYMVDNDKFPPSKKSEYMRTINNCEAEILKRNKDRYGE